MRLKLFLIALMTAVCLVFLQGDHARVTAQPITESIPPQVRSCIPETVARLRIAQAILVGQTQHQDKTYYLFRLTPASEQFEQNYTFSHVVSTGDRGCEVVYSNPMGDTNYPLSAELPQVVANQLVLAQFRQTLEQVGKPELERRARQVISSDEIEQLAPEEVWALRQLVPQAFSSQSR